MNIDKDVNYFTRGNASRKDMLKDKKQQYKKGLYQNKFDTIR